MITTDTVNTNRPLSVVIVDDEHMMRQVLRVIVSELGFKVAGEASSGDAVMPIVNERNPDLVLLDINLPGADGLELLRRIRAEHPYVKVVMISGDTTQAKVKQAVEQGAVDFIAKPFNPDAVMQKLARFAPGND
jgi:YesN/AraC family two-component response regulator